MLSTTDSPSPDDDQNVYSPLEYFLSHFFKDPSALLYAVCYTQTVPVTQRSPCEKSILFIEETAATAFDTDID
jgi:7-keto-8-aminopelargonate synthetase-like enzyme